MRIKLSKYRALHEFSQGVGLRADRRKAPLVSRRSRWRVRDRLACMETVNRLGVQTPIGLGSTSQMFEILHRLRWAGGQNSNSDNNMAPRFRNPDKPSLRTVCFLFERRPRFSHMLTHKAGRRNIPSIVGSVVISLSDEAELALNRRLSRREIQIIPRSRADVFGR